MARLRKRHVQQVLFDRVGRPLGPGGKPMGRGGKREGAGRKPKGKRAGSPHKTRPELDRRHPVHVVLRVVDVVGNLRKRHTYKALRAATIAVAKRELNDLRDSAFRIVHISIQRNHVHLLVEADNKTALSRGMQGFQISAAKHLNRAISIKRMSTTAMSTTAMSTPAMSTPAMSTPAMSTPAMSTPAMSTTAMSTTAMSTPAMSTTAMSTRPMSEAERRALRRAMAKRRRGTVFPDRYHAEIITSPKQCRHTLAYVLNNWRKHREDRDGRPSTWRVDPFSTGVHFDGWKERADAEFYMPYRDTYEPMFVYLPTTWLLREGWRRHGLISFEQVPSAKQLGRGGRAAP